MELVDENWYHIYSTCFVQVLSKTCRPSGFSVLYLSQIVYKFAAKQNLHLIENEPVYSFCDA
jgi:hypothetical protein